MCGGNHQKIIDKKIKMMEQIIQCMEVVSIIVLLNLKYSRKIQHVWLWPYKARGIVGFVSYDINIQCNSKGMSLKNIFQFYKNI